VPRAAHTQDYARNISLVRCFTTVYFELTSKIFITKFYVRKHVSSVKWIQHSYFTTLPLLYSAPSLIISNLNNFLIFSILTLGPRPSGTAPPKYPKKHIKKFAPQAKNFRMGTSQGVARPPFQAGVGPVEITLTGPIQNTSLAHTCFHLSSRVFHPRKFQLDRWNRLDEFCSKMQ